MNRLSHFSGEFKSRRRETEFQESRFPETRRHARILFLLSAILNGLFLFSDWRFYGTSHFALAVGSRVTVVAASLLCLAVAQHVRDFPALQRLLLAWQGITAICVALLVSSHSDIALFVVLLLPMIYYLAVPTRFVACLAAGMGTSLAVLAGYIIPGEDLIIPGEDLTLLGLVLALLTLNSALTITVSRHNRLRRQEWAATRAEKEARQELANSRDSLEKMFMSVPLPLLVTTPEGVIRKANTAAFDYFRETSGKTQGETVHAAYVDPDTRAILMERLLQEGFVEALETRLRRRDGSIRDVLISTRPFAFNGATSMVSSVVDITDRKLVELHLAELAMSDPLTGLANRSHFMTAANRIIQGNPAKGDQPDDLLAVLVLDIDDFKRVNDGAGHDAGDAVLRAIASRLQGAIRPGDVVARLGGDEFALLLPGLRDEAALDPLLARIMDRLRTPVRHLDRSIDCRVSLGASLFPLHADTVEALMKCADIALYEAKSRTRGRPCMFRPDLLDNWQREAGMLVRAREAIDRDTIRPFYQPKFDLRTGEILGFEALLRMIRPDGGCELPGDIAAAFEHPDLARAITSRMIDGILTDLKRWRHLGLSVGHIALNVSAVDLRDDDFADQLLRSLADAGVPPSHIELEVTESVFLGRNTDSVERALRTVSDAGIRIALDDFGTGYASLSHLKQFPIDIIKIDQRFVREIQSNPDDAAIVRAVLNLGASLGLDTVAEGIETQEQADYLRAGGCDVGQGFHFGAAMNAQDVVGMLTLPQTAHSVG